MSSAAGGGGAAAGGAPFLSASISSSSTTGASPVPYSARQCYVSIRTYLVHHIDQLHRGFPLLPARTGHENATYIGRAEDRGQSRAVALVLTTFLPPALRGASALCGWHKRGTFFELGQVEAPQWTTQVVYGRCWPSSGSRTKCRSSHALSRRQHSGHGPAIQSALRFYNRTRRTTRGNLFSRKSRNPRPRPRTYAQCGSPMRCRSSRKRQEIQCLLLS